MAFPTFEHIDKLAPYEPMPDFHAVDTITLGELLHEGVFKLDDPDMDFNGYNDEQKARLRSKIEGRFYWREISCLPIKRWKWEYVRLLNEIMPKYALLYAAAEKGIDPLADGVERGKSRDIHSDFPQTMLSGVNQDYASDGNDREWEIVRNGSTAEKVVDFAAAYKDVDALILDEMETLFSPLFSVGGLNAY